MRIPALAPDLSFPLLTQAPEDLAFSFDAKRAAMRPHIEKKWEWNEDFQLAVHRRHFEERPFFAIALNGTRIGTVSLFQQDDFVRFGEFYILPREQRRGLGTRILRHCLEIADSRNLPVRLEYLKWNPVGPLYKRHRFEVIGETDIHWLMERPAPRHGSSSVSQ